MIINSNDILQRNILTNKCFYQATADIMRLFEQRGYPNAADETAKVITAYHDIIQKKSKNAYNQDYNEAFGKIDTAIKMLANKVYYIHDNQSYDLAYRSFQNFDYIGAIIGRQRMKKKKF